MEVRLDDFFPMVITKGKYELDDEAKLAKEIFEQMEAAKVRQNPKSAKNKKEDRR